MVIKFGKVRLLLKCGNNGEGKFDFTFALSRDESPFIEKVEFWFFVSPKSEFPFWVGVGKGRYTDEVKTLKTKEIFIFKGKLKFRKDQQWLDH